MGMELGRAPGLLQSRVLGRLVESLSSSSLLLPSASGGVREPSGLPRQLGISPAALSSAVPAISAPGAASGTGPPGNSAACEARHSCSETGDADKAESANAADEAGHTDSARYETRHETLAACARQSVNSAGQAGKSRLALD